jgi:hypothetical protein
VKPAGLLRRSELVRLFVAPEKWGTGIGTQLPRWVHAQVIAGYFRVSQARDGMKAPEMYKDEIERYCIYKGLHLARIFEALVQSGRGDLEREVELLVLRHQLKVLSRGARQPLFRRRDRMLLAAAMLRVVQDEGTRAEFASVLDDIVREGARRMLGAPVRGRRVRDHSQDRPRRQRRSCMHRRSATLIGSFRPPRRRSRCTEDSWIRWKAPCGSPPQGLNPNRGPANARVSPGER